MEITRAEFDERFENGELKIALVGMSNVGKSHRGEELEAEQDFYRISVDDFIGGRLEIESIESLADWMGMPYASQFKKNQATYLEAEKDITVSALDRAPAGKNFVLDTTGSVIYLDAVARAYLEKNYLVIGFEVPDNMVPNMVETFFREPKPLIWGDFFKPLPGESNMEALRRCYPLLLKWRAAQYKELSDISLSIYTENKEEKLPFNVFWEKVRTLLPE